MSPTHLRRLELTSLAQFAMKTLGVNGFDVDADTVIDHAVCQACIELEEVEHALERQETPESAGLACVLGCIRERLEMARECSELLVTLIAEGEASQ